MDERIAKAIDADMANAQTAEILNSVVRIGPVTVAMRKLITKATLQRRELKASGGCKSPDLLRLMVKSGHLRTRLAVGIP